MLIGLLLRLSFHTWAASDWTNGWSVNTSPVSTVGVLALSADGRVVVAVGGTDFGFLPFDGSPGPASISADSGRTWRGLGLTNQFPATLPQQVAVSRDGSVIMVAGVDPSSPGIWLSEDQGRTWNAPMRGVSGASDLSADGQTIAVASGQGVTISRNRGKTWDFQSWSPTHAVAGADDPSGLALSADGETMAVTSGINVCISSDAGTTWRNVDWKGIHGTIAADSRLVLVLSRDGRHLAAAVTLDLPPGGGDYGRKAALLLSEDAGLNWRPVASPAGYDIASLAITDGGQKLLAGTVEYCCASGNPWVSGGSLFFTDDAGNTWQQLDPRLYHSEKTDDGLSSPDEAGVVALSADGSVQLAGLRGSAPVPIPFLPGPLLSYGVVYPPAIKGVDMLGDQSLTGDLSVGFSVVASGSQLTFQWRKDGVLLADAPNRTGTASAQITVSPATVADLGTYTVTVSNSEGSVQRDVGTLGIAPPQIVTISQYGGPVLTDGAPLTFSVTASGGLFSYQWFRNDQELADDALHTGTRSAKLQVLSGAAEDIGIYSVAVTNPLGTVTRVVGRIELGIPKLLGLEALTGPFLPAGETVRLRVWAEGGEISIRWLHEGIPLDARTATLGFATNELAIPLVSSAACGRYSAVISNRLGQVESATVLVAISDWHRAGLSSDAWHSAGISADGRRLIAASYQRLMTSPDGGGHWSEHLSTNGPISTATLAPDGELVLVGQPSARSGHWGNGGGQPDWQPRWLPVETGDYLLNSAWGDSLYPSAIACSGNGQMILTNPKNMMTHPGMIYYGLGIVGSLWSSPDGSATWREPEVPQGLDEVWYSPSMSSDGTLQVVRHTWLWSGGDDAYLSSDSGLTWRKLKVPALNDRSPLVVSPDGSTIALAGTNRIFLSQDHGLTWTPTASPDRVWTRICLSSDGHRLFAVGAASPWDSGEIYQSMDAGRTWQWAGSPSAHWTSLACSADGLRVIGASDEGVFLSPARPAATDTGVPATASPQNGGVRFHWQGQPGQTYRLLQTDRLGDNSWQSAGAAIADNEGRFSVTLPSAQVQSFWRAVETP